MSIFNDVYCSKPINKTAAIVSVNKKPQTMSEIDELFARYDNLTRAMKNKMAEMAKLDTPDGKYQRQKVNEERMALVAERRKMCDRYPFLAKKQRNLQSYILDEVKKRLSPSEWNACVRMGRKQMLATYDIDISDIQDEG